MRLESIIAPLRRPATLAGAGFLVVAGSIFANALFLQGGRHPAPLFSPRGDAAEPGSSVQGRDTLTEAVQAALRERGFYSGPVDGRSGPQTAAAIVAFESASGLPQTGKATAPLLAAILAPARADPPGGAPPDGGDVTIASLMSPDRIAAVQGALSRAAYGQITPDGVLGAQTRDAIRRFQADHGLPVTGEMSDALMIELRAAGALDGD